MTTGHTQACYQVAMARQWRIRYLLQSHRWRNHTPPAQTSDGANLTGFPVGERSE